MRQCNVFLEFLVSFSYSGAPYTPLGMTPSVEDKFLHLKDSMIKTARNQQQHAADVKMLEGVFELADLADSRHLEVKVETLQPSGKRTLG